MTTVSVLTLREEQAAATSIFSKLAESFSQSFLSQPDGIFTNPMPTQPQHSNRSRGSGLSNTAAQVMVVVVGPAWSHALLQSYNQRVRFELSALLQRSPATMLVLPVLVNNASMPAAADLPPEFRAFPLLQALQVREMPHFTADIQSVVQRIQQFTLSVQQLRWNQGNYTGYKIYSFVPFGALVVFAIITKALQINGPYNLSPGISVLLHLLAIICFATLISLWPISTVIALTSQRYRWAWVNGIALPTSVALLLIAPLIQQLPSVWQIVLYGIVTVGFITTLFVLPIVFALNLPPHRQAKAG